MSKQLELQQATVAFNKKLFTEDFYCASQRQLVCEKNF